MTPTLLIPRKLAIQILHEAQIAQPDAIQGWVYARGGEPAAYRHAREDMNTHRAEESLWARLWSYPAAPAEPAPSELREGILNLVISLNTKGVLELRAWVLEQGVSHEREIAIAD